MRTTLLTSSAAALLAGTAFALPGVSSPNPVDVLAAKRAQAMIEQPSLFNSSVALRRDGYTSPVHNAGLLLSKRQESEQCGPDNAGRKCAGQRCCSFYGWCGQSSGYCSEFFCLPQFGWCTGQPIPSSAAPPVSTPAPPVSTPAPPVSTPATPPSSSAAAPPATPSSSTPATPPASGGNSKASQDGRCGPEFGDTYCPDQKCCSMYSYCGTGSEFCNAFGCQTGFGFCEGEAPFVEPAAPATPQPTPVVSSSSAAAPPPVASSSSSAASPPPATPSSSTPAAPPASGGNSKASQDGRCGPEFGDTYCPDQKCCSMYSYCGEGTEFCNAFGCQTGFGFCEGEAPFVEPAAPATPQPTPEPETTPEPEVSPEPSQEPATPEDPVTQQPPQTGLTVSPDGRCGNGSTCAGSEFGNCCSKWYFCGGDEDYCMDDCRSDLGGCGAEAMPQPEPEPEIVYPPVSLSGQCGNGTSCLGSGFGDCCSYFYYCGYGQDYCGTNCRKDSGVCYG